MYHKPKFGMTNAPSSADYSANRRIIVQTFTVPFSTRFLEGQPAFLRQHGYEVELLTSQNEQLPTWVFEQQIPHHQVPFRRSWFSLTDDFRCFVILCRYFKKQNPLVVHGNTPKAAFLSLLAAWLWRVPVRVYELHGLPLETATGWKRWCIWLVEKCTCSVATQVVAVSHSLRVSALKHRLVAPAKIKVLHQGSCSGIDGEKKFNPQENDSKKLNQLREDWGLRPHQHLVGFVGRLTVEKGLNELYEAWQQVKAQCPTARLLLVGQNDEREPLPRTLIEKIQNDVTILATGQIENVRDYYALMDFLVLPSHREGFGNVVIEAASMGKPTIAAEVTGLKDAVVANRTGIFCEVKNSASLAEKILFYLQNPATAHQHGQEASARVARDFSPQDVWTAKLHLYEGLVAQTRPVPLPNVSPLLQTSH